MEKKEQSKIFKENYFFPDYKRQKDDLVCFFYAEPSGKLTLEETAQRIASESSIGTWTNISNMSEELFKKYSPKIFMLDKKTKTFRIAYPKELFEEHNIAQITATIAGNVFGMKYFNNLKLLDIDFPESFIRHYSGPMYGVEGVRKKLKIKNRPFVSSVVKPKLGLSETEHSKIAYDSWMGGCDFVSDDENLTSMPFNNFEKRVKLTLKQKEKAEKETGEKKAYLPNITAPYPEMVKRLEHVLKNGGEFVLVDVMTVGWSALQALKDQDYRVVIHGHRAGHAILTRNPKHGISMLALAKICRLIGVDQLQVGGFNGKMSESKNDLVCLGEAIEKQVVSEDIFKHRLQENWLNLKPVLAVCSGGLSPISVKPIIHAMGRGIALQFGGGIHGHPKGTIAGARAARQAVESEMLGLEITEYAKEHPELKEAIKKWGTKKC